MEFHVEKLDKDKLKEYRKIIEPRQYVLCMDEEIVSNPDKSVLFFCLGGQGYAAEETGAPPNYYCLIFNGVVIPLYGRNTTSKLNDTFIRTYVFGGVLIPEKLREFKHQIYLLITEAIATMHRYVWKNNSNVVVNISEPKYV